MTEEHSGGVVTFAFNVFLSLTVVTYGASVRHVTTPPFQDLPMHTRPFDFGRPNGTENEYSNYSYIKVADRSQTDYSQDTLEPGIRDCYYSKAKYIGQLEIGCISPWQGRTEFSRTQNSSTDMQRVVDVFVFARGAKSEIPLQFTSNGGMICVTGYVKTTDANRTIVQLDDWVNLTVPDGHKVAFSFSYALFVQLSS
ncbi:hypothetical protein BaRGS_00036247 [Batillaria attramentaria]|uniref:Uncharacterized protein n=1 Tax=Batillaria attramentaria TaxID=370345 RepID=A0ABD0JCC6_9CAEN